MTLSCTLMPSQDEREAIRTNPVEFARRLEVRLRDRSVVQLGTVLSDQQESVIAKLGQGLNEQCLGHRIAIVKARQLGVTTALRAWFVWKALTTPGIVFGLLSNKTRGAKEIQKIDIRMFTGLERVFGRLVASMNAGEIKLLNGSRILYFSGKAVNDRGYTMDGLHVSEFAHVDGGGDLLATLLQSVPDHGTVVLESTPSHYGDPLHRIVQISGKSDEFGTGAWSVMFFPWYEFDLYRREIDCATKQELEKKVHEHPLWDVEQEAWRRAKIDELSGDEQMFRREFPSSIKEAYALAEGSWLGDEIVDKAPIGLYKERVEGAASSYGLKVLTLHRAVSARNNGRRYVIGVDPAGGVGQDFSVAMVLDCVTLEVVQVISGNRVGVEEFAQRVAVASGEWKAGVLVEQNNHGARCINALSSALVHALPFLTTARSKIDILEALRHLLHTSLMGFIDMETSTELRSMVRQPNGKAPAAVIGAHDDRVMALALAIRARVEFGLENAAARLQEQEQPWLRRK